MRALLVAALAVAGCKGSGSKETEPAAKPQPAAPSLADPYRDAATRILAAARSDAAVEAGFARLRHLTDEIGHRLAGSEALDRAIAWAAQVMKEDGHDVRTEKVMVPHWVRGAESARMTAPYGKDLGILGLGGTVATPAGGVTAPVVVVTSWDELEAKKAEVAGKIVLYDVPMPAWSEEHGPGYGKVVGYRGKGAAEAAKHGAVGALVRSVTAHSLATPHTGAMSYEDGVAKIPAASITVEDAELIHRLVDAGEEVKVSLVLSGTMKPDAESANVIGELRGRERPDEIVVIGAHIDSWDVGQGAHDDGAGCVAVMQALRTLRTLGLTPRRTIRVVLFTNEENGLAGAGAYAEAHAAEIGEHVMALEMDSGGFAPIGLGFHDGVVGERTPEQQARHDRIATRLGELIRLLEPLDATRIIPGFAGADIAPLARGGVPALGLMMDSRTYFDYHHTEADTLDKVKPEDLAADAAAIAVIAYAIAEMPGRLDDP